MTPGPDPQRERVVGVRRRIQATRAFLYRAWIDPARFVSWFGPKAWTVDRCEIDARPGGAWRAWLRRGDGAQIRVGGVYTEVEPGQRLVFTWDNDAQGRTTDAMSIVTVEFIDCVDGVEVRVTHRELTTDQAFDMDVGWTSALASLEEYVSAERQDVTDFQSEEEDQ